MISNDTYIVVVDKTLIIKIENYVSIDWRDIQNGSVQIWGYRLKELGIQEFSQKPGLYKWDYKYDSFIGFMVGILDNEMLKKTGLSIV